MIGKSSSSILSRHEDVVAESWFDKLRAAAFGHGWAVPGFALAGVIFASVFVALFVVTYDGSPDISRSDVNTPANVTEQPKPAAVTPPQEHGVVPDRQNDLKVVQTAAAPATGRSTPKRAARNEKRNLPNVEPRQASAGRVQPRLPTLEPVEEEDTSLRLAELFEDVETSR
jgi:hypothetical protein